MDVIRGNGCSISLGPSGYFTLVLWHRCDVAGMQSTYVDGLTWTELVDVLLTELDATRPGTGLLERQAVQPTLF